MMETISEALESINTLPGHFIGQSSIALCKSRRLAGVHYEHQDGEEKGTGVTLNVAEGGDLECGQFGCAGVSQPAADLQHNFLG